jgi:amino-acid N-acetyltransferase
VIYRQAQDSDEGVIRTLLESQGLPTESVGTGKTVFFLAFDGGNPVGIAGFEYYGDDALLRSIAVPSELQNKKIGSQLVDWMIDLAKQNGKRRIVLLTESAERFFSRKGFATVSRSSIDNAAMKQSSQFAGGSCCSEAACMVLELCQTPAQPTLDCGKSGA